MEEGRGSVGPCPTGYQEAIPAGSCCTGAASLADCGLERAVICDDEEGFGLSIAPKFMNMIVRCVTRGLPSVDSYVDDLKTPSKDCPDVAFKLAEHGLPTKPADPFADSRVLGLQLSKDEET